MALEKMRDRAVVSAKPKEKSYKLSDGGGLYVEVMPNGSKFFRLKFQHGGKEGRMTFGQYPIKTLAEAREDMRAAKKLLAEGINPVHLRRHQKLLATTGTFSAMFEEWFEVKSPDWAELNIKKIRQIAERDLLPWLGVRAVKEITAPEVLACLRRIEARGALDTARRASQTVSQVFTLAIATGRAEMNPAALLSGVLKKPISKRRAAITDPAEVGEMLRMFEVYRGGLIVKTALHLSALTWVRPGELRQAEWADVDLERAEWLVNVKSRKLTKVKKRTAEPHWVPLSKQAVEHLRTLEALTGRGRFIFPGGRNTVRPMSEGAVLGALRSLGLSKEKMCAHGFRATASTLLNQQGWNPDAIERQLAHIEPNAVRDAYNRATYEEERREMMQAWADYLDTLASERTPVISRGQGRSAPVSSPALRGRSRP